MIDQEIDTRDHIARDVWPIARNEPPALDDEQDMPQVNMTEADIDIYILPPVMPEADLNLPRRSKRDCRPPAWSRSGDFVLLVMLLHPFQIGNRKPII